MILKIWMQAMDIFSFLWVLPIKKCNNLDYNNVNVLSRGKMYICNRFCAKTVVLGEQHMFQFMLMRRILWCELSVAEEMTPWPLWSCCLVLFMVVHADLEYAMVDFTISYIRRIIFITTLQHGRSVISIIGSCDGFIFPVLGIYFLLSDSSSFYFPKRSVITWHLLEFPISFLTGQQASHKVAPLAQQ